MSSNDWKIAIQDWNCLIEENIYPRAVATEMRHNICMKIKKNWREVTRRSPEIVYLGL
jgi:hypothetical protein